MQDLKSLERGGPRLIRGENFCLHLVAVQRPEMLGIRFPGATGHFHGLVRVQDTVYHVKRGRYGIEGERTSCMIAKLASMGISEDKLQTKFKQTLFFPSVWT